MLVAIPVALVTVVLHVPFPTSHEIDLLLHFAYERVDSISDI